VSSTDTRHEIDTAGVAVLFNGKSVLVDGRAAFTILWIAALAQRINSIPLGRLVVDFAHEQVKPKLWESEPGDIVDKFLADLV
jgi:hypothetical protein